MVGTVVAVRLDAEHRISAEDTGLHRILDTGVNCRNILLRDGTADRGVDKLVSLLRVGIHRAEDNLAVTVLTGTTGLLLVFAVDVDFLGDGLLVGNLRRTYIGLDLELAEKTVYDDLQMELAHAGDQRLSGLLVGRHAERGILLSKLCQSLAHLVLTCFRLRLDRDFDNGLRELHGLQDYRMILIADRIAGRRDLETYGCRDIAGVHLLKLLALVRMHLQDTADTLLLVLGRVEHIGTGVHRTRVNAEVSKLTYEGVGHDLECKSRKRLLIRRLSRNIVAVLVNTLDVRDVGRSGKILDNGIQKLLNALVAVCGTAQNGDDLRRDGSGTKGLLQSRYIGYIALEVLLQKLVVGLADGFHHLLAILLRLILHVIRDIRDLHGIALRIRIVVRLHLHQVHKTLEGVLLADRQLQSYRVLAEAGLDHGDYVEEIRTGDIHFVDKCDSRHVVFVCLTPNCLRLRLNTALRAEHADGAVQHAERTLHLDREVYVAGGVDDIDSMFQLAGLRLVVFLKCPMAGGCGRSDRDTALLLLLHPVHGRSAFVRITDFVVDTCVIQDSLGESRLAGIDVSHDTDITGSLKRVFSSSQKFVLLITSGRDGHYQR